MPTEYPPPENEYLFGAESEEEFERVYSAAYQDMLAADFCGISYYVTMWGTKAEE